MTEERRSYWLAYFRELADRMHLRDWQVAVNQVPPTDEDAWATVECTFGRKHLDVRLAPDWDKQPPDRQRHYAVHELVHPHLIAAQDMVEIDLKDILGHEGHELFRRPYRRAVEYAVDALAEVIAPHMPLPPERGKSAPIDSHP